MQALDWGHRAVCNNLLITVNPRCLLSVVTFMLYIVSSWQEKKGSKFSYILSLSLSFSSFFLKIMYPYLRMIRVWCGTWFQTVARMMMGLKVKEPASPECPKY